MESPNSKSGTWVINFFVNSAIHSYYRIRVNLSVCVWVGVGGWVGGGGRDGSSIRETMTDDIE